jgi:hypothetical protein
VFTEPLPRNGLHNTVVLLCVRVFGRGEFTEPLPGNALGIHVTILLKKILNNLNIITNFDNLFHCYNYIKQYAVVLK